MGFSEGEGGTKRRVIKTGLGGPKDRRSSFQKGSGFHRGRLSGATREKEEKGVMSISRKNRKSEGGGRLERGEELS